MNGLRIVFALALALSVSSCTSIPANTDAGHSKLPWDGMSPMAFRDLLASYAAANLEAHPEETIDNYLRSQTRTFDRYVAAKEAGVSMEPLKLEALSEIQQLSAVTKGRLFALSTRIDVAPYDVKQEGFPIFQRPFDLGVTVQLNNSDIRTTISTGHNTRGVAVFVKDYGFASAEIEFSKQGWILPIAPDQAARVLEVRSRTGRNRSLDVVIIYSLDRCDAYVESDPPKLSCRTTVRSIYAVDPNRIENGPSAELVHRADATHR